jgi:hypothetical protein
MTTADRRVICVACPDGARPPSRKNIRAHYKAHHPAKVNGETVKMFREIPAAGAALVPVPATRPAPPDLPPLGVEDVDGIVLGVVDQLAGPAGMLPVAHLPALLLWREATAAFLRAVTR